MIFKKKVNGRFCIDVHLVAYCAPVATSLNINFLNFSYLFGYCVKEKQIADMIRRQTLASVKSICPYLFKMRIWNACKHMTRFDAGMS
jgi:hypothetical protein